MAERLDAVALHFRVAIRAVTGAHDAHARLHACRTAARARSFIHQSINQSIQSPGRATKGIIQRRQAVGGSRHTQRRTASLRRLAGARCRCAPPLPACRPPARRAPNTLLAVIRRKSAYVLIHPAVGIASRCSPCFCTGPCSPGWRSRTGCRRWMPCRSRCWSAGGRRGGGGGTRGGEEQLCTAVHGCLREQL